MYRRVYRRVYHKVYHKVHHEMYKMPHYSNCHKSQTSQRVKLRHYKTMSVTFTLQGKSTFAFDAAKRRAIEHLQKTNNTQQIRHLPETYPQQLSQISGVDIVPRIKILKAHLEDVFGTADKFSVSVIPKKRPLIRIIHDIAESETIESIACLYAHCDDIRLERFSE